jgi:superfamily II RNA helicase
VAAALHFKAMCEGRRSFYTCPIKALVSEKFFALCEDFGAQNVGMMTGDATINRDAPIVCCTAEILASMGLREGASARVDYAILDEFHYYSDRARGIAWQLPLLTLPQSTFLLMSATLGDTQVFEKRLQELTGRPAVTVRSAVRPVPLDFRYSEAPLHETLAELVKEGLAPVYLVNFTQRAAAEEAQSLLSTDWCSKDEKRAIAEALYDVRFDSPYGKDLQRFLKHGVGVHHAGLLPRYRLAVERLAQKGLLKVLSGTDTLGVGVNIPLRTVLFTKLCKYDGERTALLTVRDFHQIAGRAGRKGFDDRGTVVAQAPEHVIENLRLEQKAGDDPAKRRKIVKRKPPEKGYVHWDASTFERLRSSAPERLTSRFQVTHGLLLAVLQRPGRTHDGCRALAKLVRDCHEPEGLKRAHGRHALALFRSLVDAGVVTLAPGTDGRRHFQVSAEYAEDFSLNNTLGLYLLEALAALDPEAESYHLDVLTLVESVLEDPDVVLFKQVDKLKGEKVAELKAQGVEYEARMEALEKIEHPKPMKDFLYDTFNLFARHHPWVGAENIRPKSVARELYENAYSFNDYVKEYGLERAEGVLLRYLTDAYKTLRQTVPRSFKSPAVDDLEATLRTLLRDTDASLLDAWEAMQAEVESRARPNEPRAPEPKDITRDARTFGALVRRSVYGLLRALAARDWQTAARRVDQDPEDPWTPQRFAQALAPFFDEFPTLRTDHAARSPQNTLLEPLRDGTWRVRQILCDPEDFNEWCLTAVVDLARSREADRPVLRVLSLGV